MTRQLTNKAEELRNLRERLDKMWDSTNDNECPKQELIVLLMDSIKNLLEVKEIKQHHVDIIKESIIVLNKKVTGDTVDYYMKYLIDNGIPIVLLPVGISEMYDL